MITSEKINAILPQTQCGLCGFNGCKPYADALAEKKASIDLCPPGGLEGLIAIATLVNEDPAPYREEMEKKAKPFSRAVIREAECIGCAKCIKACPVDAILGSGKLLHTVIADECTGCELCIAPCPVDCIDMVPVPHHVKITSEQSTHYRKRYEARQARLKTSEEKAPAHTTAVLLDKKKAFVEAAVLRAKAKALTKY